MALNHVGFPTSTAVFTVNRACSSGLQAITSIADAIAVGRIDAGIGGGMESMTRNYASKAIPRTLWDALRTSPVQAAVDCIMPMGLTSENVAERYGISRNDQDALAVSSHAKATKAELEGLFESEIVPMKVGSDPDSQITVTRDDGIRPGTTMETLAKLKPVFVDTGSSTAGNSSQISDGAAAALLMRRSTAELLGLKQRIIGKWVGTKVVGVKPDEMGIGPAIAIPMLLESLGLTVADVGLWEINEAFASQALYCVRQLGIDLDKVNPKGGAIALGHPLGATGVRQLATLLPEMKRQGQEIGLISMCIGTGMGMGSLIVRE
jgi:acetyl-CoA acyltransferase 1